MFLYKYTGYKDFFMGGDIKSTDFQTNVSNSIKSTIDNAKQEMLAKQAEYDAAKQQEEIYRALMLQYKRESDKSGVKGDKLAKYKDAVSLFNNAEINTDVLRSSLQDRISYCGKMNNVAIIANSILA